MSSPPSELRVTLNSSERLDKALAAAVPPGAGAEPVAAAGADRAGAVARADGRRWMIRG